MRVLIADDNAKGARSLRESLDEQGYVCNVALTMRTALAVLRRGACDLVICDVRLASSRTFELLVALKHASARIPVIILTGDASPSAAVKR